MANGTNGDDFLNNNDQENYGFDGNDRIISGFAGGFTTINGGNGNDFLEFRGSTSGAIDGGIGDDRIVSGTGADTIGGGDGSDFIEGGVEAGVTGNDFIVGGKGADGLYGYDGDDLIYGGDGDDDGVLITIFVYKNTSVTFLGGLHGGNGNDKLFGGEGKDFLFGGDGADTLYGENGDDTLDGGDGADVLYGNFGDDYLFVDNDGFVDVLEGGAGSDTYSIFFYDPPAVSDIILEFEGEGDFDCIETSLDFALEEGMSIEILKAVLDPSYILGLELTGNTSAQEIIGGEGNDVLNDGGAGMADILRGGAGDDTYMVFNAGDTIIDSEGFDVVIAAVSYALTPGASVEQLTTNDSSRLDAINLTGNTLQQEITGNAGANVLHDGGKGAADTLRGLGGDDTYRIFNSADVIVEGQTEGAADKVMAAVDYRLGAGVHIELLVTNGSTATTARALTGNEFAQAITGNYGDNRLEGKGGNDTLRGLSGKDTFVFATAPGAGNVDTITDFNVADDRFLLSDAIFKALTPGTLSAAAFRANTTGLAQDASDRIIYETDTGNLFYDADGIGGSGGIQFAKISVGLALTNADFSVA